MQASKSVRTITPLHIAVMLLGVLVFVLLLFADKTNLNDDSAEGLGGGAKENGTTAEADISGNNTAAMLSMLPPLNPPEELAARVTALEETRNPEDRVNLLREIVNGFRNSGRVDVAAVYAGELARTQPQAKNLVVAGALFRNATALPAMQTDTSLFRRFSDEALRFLESAVELEPKNEDALIELGLAMVESRRGTMGMQGIFKLREVLDLNPENTEAMFHLGQKSIETGQFDRAEARFRKILELEPKNHRARYFLGIAVRGLNKSAEYKQLMAEVAAQQDDLSLAALAESALNEIK